MSRVEGKFIDQKTLQVTNAIEVNIGTPQFVTRSTTFVTASRFLFRGTNKVGIPTHAYLIGAATSGQTAEVRIYDVTNAQTICTTTYTGTAQAIRGPLSVINLPAGPAVFEVQVRRSAGGNSDVYCSYAGLFWSAT